MVKYIAQLLEEQDCVIIPELGGLVGNYQPAKVDMHKQQISPPYKQVAFNRNLIHNDGLLANKVSVSEGILYGEALQKVRDFVKQCINSLEQNGSCVLDDLGRLYFDTDRRIQFSPQLTKNYLPDAYGLPVLDLKPIQRYREAARVLAANLPAGVTMHEEERQPRWAYAVLGSLAILALVVSFALNLSQVEKVTDFSSIFPLPTANVEAPVQQHDVPLVDSPAPNIAIVDIESLQVEAPAVAYVEPAVEEEVAEVAATAKKETGSVAKAAAPLMAIPPEAFDRSKYHTIIVGAFVVPKNATRYAGELKSEGYEVHILPHGRFNRVGLMFDTSFLALPTALDSVRRTVEQNAWVLR